MKMYGFSKKGNKVTELKEISLCCMSEDVDKLIEFLSYTKRQLPEGRTSAVTKDGNILQI